MLDTKLVRIEAEGQLALPVEVRQRLGFNPGDLVALIETPDGLLITSRDAGITYALDKIGEILRGRDLSLDDLIESGREVRAAIIREQYGIDPDSSPS